jgi:CubicO group peptidase (beta-lactamase class C family)
MSTLEELFDTARADVDSGWLPSCQLAVGHNGKIVATTTFGDATDATRYCIFSCTKPIVAGAAWLLIGEGKLDPARRVAEYIPEFAANGKESVTVEQVMLHTSGFPNAVMKEIDGTQPETRVATLAKWELEWEPGTRFEYHGTSAHWVLVDLIERLGGIDFRDYIEQRVCAPLGLPRLLGIPETDTENFAQLVAVGDGSDTSPAGRDVDAAIGRLRDPAIRAAGVPGYGAIMRAADLAGFYQGVMDNPGGLWDTGVLDDAKTNVRCTFPDNLMQVPVNRTLGLVLAGSDGQHFMRYGSFGVANSPRSIGHAGAHMQIGWGDPETGISFAYCTNGLDADVMKEGARGVNLAGIAAALVL